MMHVEGATQKLRAHADLNRYEQVNRQMNGRSKNVTRVPWFAFAVVVGIGVFVANLTATFLPLKDDTWTTVFWAGAFAGPGSIGLGIVWPLLRWKWGLVLFMATAGALGAYFALEPVALSRWGMTQGLGASACFACSACLSAAVGATIGRQRSAMQ